jgi:hypothetical protein
VQQYLNLIHFPVACEFRNAALGRRREIRVGALKGFLHLPRPNPKAIGESFSELLPPRVRDIDFAIRVFNHGTSNVWERLWWGKYFTYNIKDPEGTAVASVSYAAMTFPAMQSANFMPLRDVAKECIEHMPAWCGRLSSWIEAITKDDLDAAHPAHASIDPERWTTTAWITSSNGKPNYDYVNPTAILMGSLGKAAMTADQWHAAVRGANACKEPSDIHLLLRDARAARLRGHGRRAILSLATAVELVIEPALRKHLSKSLSPRQVDNQLANDWQFSQRQKLMTKNGMWLPPDLQNKVMSLRNKVAHKNGAVSRAQADAAIEIVEKLVSRYSPLKLP